MDKSAEAHIRYAVFVAVVVACPAIAVAQQNPAAQLEAPTVEVVGTTPLPGLGTPIDQVPANVQAATGREIERQQSTDLSEFLERNLVGVNINSGQNNPFQPDVNFRGFTASPLLGTPQGISVFQDGVRINEAFGDTVNWDLIPRSAISSINLIPGSNPVFGLNTLGGSLAIHTKSGFEYPGFSAQAYGGSFGRKAVEFEAGGHGERADYFVTGNFFDEDGWREHSPSRVKQLFAKTGYQNDTSDVDFSFTGADNVLEGTQSLPLSLLGNARQAYTFPDRTENRLAFFNLKGSHFITPVNLIAANAYYRKLKTDGFNSNVNNDFDPTQPLASGNTPAANDTSMIDQKGFGGSLQYSNLADVFARGNQVTVGFSADLGRTDFAQFSQEADFTADRGTVALGDSILNTQVATRNDYYGVYLTDTFSITRQLTVTAAGRYNYATIDIEDRSGVDPALTGSSAFSRFNPAIGLNYNPITSLTSYVAYNEGLRAPTPVELTCADQAAPCKLPNNFLADPPLKPVVSRTVEVGARGKFLKDFGWSAAVYRTRLADDILFISSGGAVNAGFFQNVGQTRRQGVELGLQRNAGRFAFSTSYSFIDATFESPLAINSPNNSGANADGDIQVAPGNRVPGIPRHSLKIRGDYQITDLFSAGASVQAFTSQFARGDENNQDSNGQVPGYAVFNLDARYQVGRDWQLFASITNLFDKRFENFGVLGTNFFTGPGNTFDAANATPEQFRSSGAPRGAWVGVRFAWRDGKSRNDGTAKTIRGADH